MPSTKVGDVLGKQILRSGTSVVANYRAASKARSPADFISKIGIVEEEADETLFWLEVLEEAEIVKVGLLDDIKKEANEILSIMVSSSKTAKMNRKK